MPDAHTTRAPRPKETWPATQAVLRGLVGELDCEFADLDGAASTHFEFAEAPEGR